MVIFTYFLFRLLDQFLLWYFPLGVYKSGFATSQEAYNAAVVKVFEGLDRVEEILSKQRLKLMIFS